MAWGIIVYFMSFNISETVENKIRSSRDNKLYTVVYIEAINDCEFAV